MAPFHQSMTRMWEQFYRDPEKLVKLNPDKSVLRVTELNYFGNILTTDGLRPDPAKVVVITDMPAPTNSAKLSTVLGMANCIDKFFPGLAETTTPVRTLMKKDVEYVWNKQQNKAFQQMKDYITSAKTLAYFSPQKEITVQVDTLQRGLGRQTGCLCIKFTYSNRKELFPNWEGYVRHRIWMWEVPSLHLRQSHNCRVRSQSSAIHHEEATTLSTP